ncbi:MAG: hypothetical protein MJH10_10830 [Epibacterium sp.]|nr:hypothetical protein [Epibacterium sp.]NQX74036.1 hypothetical protein [Epibacterium sp.]
MIEVWEVTMTDLWRDGCGWVENGAWRHVEGLRVPAGISDLALARKVLAVAGYTGVRMSKLDTFWWRHGTIGIRADFIGHEEEL